ncbi:MAG: glycoside hydrolase family 57 protein [Thermoproteota archaeon]|jgi:Alpha-amylase/alpha-mannosidase
MKQVIFFFEAHQPRRIRPYRRNEIGKNHDYFWKEKNEEILNRVINKCYIPMTIFLIDNNFPCSISISGVLLEQLLEINSEVIDLFKEYFKSGIGELVGETYYHSLASIWNFSEFEEQVKIHEENLRKIFGIKPVTFRNTELIYSDEISFEIKKLGYKNVLTEGTDEIISKYNPNYMYSSVAGLNLFLRNYRLSDDISFRFSNYRWNEYPLFADKYAKWIYLTPGEVINLFMDYETFGEHNWKETGIFDFMKYLPLELKKYDIELTTIKSFAEKNVSKGTISINKIISWADIERDLSAWLGNDLQREAFDFMISLNKNRNMHIWRILQTSDHFYYMSTKMLSDQEVHEYFNPYKSPYLAFIYYTNILEDFRITYCF